LGAGVGRDRSAGGGVDPRRRLAAHRRRRSTRCRDSADPLRSLPTLLAGRPRARRLDGGRRAPGQGVAPVIPRRAQEVIILVIGVFTPLGVLAVNGSAFLMRHLPETRLILAFGALLSGLLLNGLAAYAGHRRARRHVPDLLNEYRWWI